NRAVRVQAAGGDSGAPAGSAADIQLGRDGRGDRRLAGLNLPGGTQRMRLRAGRGGPAETAARLDAAPGTAAGKGYGGDVAQAARNLPGRVQAARLQNTLDSHRGGYRQLPAGAAAGVAGRDRGGAGRTALRIFRGAAAGKESRIAAARL